MTGGEARPFFGFTVTRPVAISMVALAVCFFGVIGLMRLPQNLLPDISYPTLTVRTEYLGASPRDVEERVSEKVQELVAVVPGVRRLYSVSRPGVSDVVLEFAWGTEMVFAVADVRERLDRFFAPAGAGRPLVLRYDPSLDPVLTLGLTSTDPTEDLIALRRYAELQLDDELAQIEGTAAVELRGGDAEEIRIAVDEQALAAKGLDIATVSARLAAENMNAASGAIEEGRTEFLVRALNEYRDLKEIEDTILVSRGDARVRLGEVAKVSRVPADPVVISRIGGKPAVLIDIHKQAEANIVDLCQRVRERVFGTPAQQAFVAAGKATGPLPAADEDDPQRRLLALQERAAMTGYLAFDLGRQGMQIAPLLDQSTFIESAISEVLQNALVGGGLAILVIFLFLRSVFATAVLAASIPISLLATFAPMFLSGIDLNIMSLGGLALGVGMLVDNSIVVLESIEKQREAGLDRAAAAVQGVRRVAGAVIASTLTTVAVFFPIVFVEGLAGQLFKDQALTVVYALLMSLLVALFVVPMLASRGGLIATDLATSPPGRMARAAGRLLRLVLLLLLGAGKLVLLVLRPAAALFQRAYGVVDRAYPPLLRASLAQRWLLLLVVLALAVFAARTASQLGQRVLPEVHQGEFWLEAFLPRHATVRATDATMRQLEAQIAALPEVQSTFLASGVDPEKLNDSETGKHSARLLVRLLPGDDTAARETSTQAAISALVQREPRVQSHRFATTSALQFKAGITVEVIGHDLLALRRSCELIAARLQQLPMLQQVRSTLQRGNPELSIELDRDQLAALGLDAGSVAQLLRRKVQGEVPTLFAERERKIDLRVRTDRGELQSERDLRRLNVNPQGYPEIPLSAVGKVERREGPSEIRRLGNVRGAEVQASLRGFDLAGTQNLVAGALADLQLPRGVAARLGGQKEELERSNQSLMMALWMAVFLVYIVMAAQFENLLQPLIILVSVPLALIGVVFALRLFAVDLSVIVFLGAIVLAGIVVNNAIILIDQTNKLRAEGMPLGEAVVQGAHSRLRPVLMTTLTTLLGLLPQTGLFNGIPVLGGSPDGIELRAPMAVTVIAGLGCSTLLTLLVVPVIYASVTRRRT